MDGINITSIGFPATNLPPSDSFLYLGKQGMRDWQSCLTEEQEWSFQRDGLTSWNQTSIHNYVKPIRL